MQTTHFRSISVRSKLILVRPEEFYSKQGLENEGYQFLYGNTSLFFSKSLGNLMCMVPDVPKRHWKGKRFQSTEWWQNEAFSKGDHWTAYAWRRRMSTVSHGLESCTIPSI